MATNLKINVFKKTKLETTYSIPCKVIKIGTGIVPAPVVAALNEEGISIDEVAKLSSRAELSGVIIEIERHSLSEKVIFSLE